MRNCQNIFLSGFPILPKPPTMHMGLNLSRSLLTIIFTSYFTYLSGYNIVCHCGFDLHFLMTNVVEHLFMACNLHLFFREIFIQILHLFLIWLFVFLLLCYKCSLDILDTNPLSRYVICKYFLPLCGSPFHFLGGLLWSMQYKVGSLAISTWHVLICTLLLGHMVRLVIRLTKVIFIQNNLFGGIIYFIFSKRVK